MMNQGSNTETVTRREPNSIENQHVADAAQGQTSSYFPSTAGSEAVPWTMQRGENYSMDNRTPNIAYNHGQHSEPPSKDVQDALNATSHASSSSLGAHSSVQQYNGYASYSSSTDPYGYANTGYTGYYSSYQQQPNNAYPQPAGAYQNTGAPYQSLSSFQNSGSYAGSATYSTTYYNPGDYQTAGCCPSSGYNSQTTTSWNEGNYANYTHQYPNYTPDSSGTYSSNTAPVSSQQYQQDYSKQWADYYSQTEVTCAPGTEKLSVTSTSNTSYLAPVSGGYPVSNSQTHAPITPSWRPESSSSISSIAQPPAPSSSVHDGYWKYGAPTLQNHLAGSAQPQYQKPFDPAASYNTYQDQQKAASYNSYQDQQKAASSYNSYQDQQKAAPSYNSYQDQQKAAPSYNSYRDQDKAATSQIYSSYQDQQKTLVPQVYNSFQDQQRTVIPQVCNNFQDQQKTARPQGSTFQYPTLLQAPLGHQPSGQTPPSSDTRRVNIMQIPTNPRIASNFPLGLTKIEKDSSTVGGASKPAYIGVSLPKPIHKVSSNNASDFKTGTFPPSLRGYVERALARCKDDTQKAACQGYMKEMITKATADGTLFTRNWDTEPLFPIPDANVISDGNQQCQMPDSSLPKFAGRRTKSRWEPLPEEKPSDKNAAIITGTPKYNSWSNVNERDRKLFGGNSEGKNNGVSSAKFSWSEQKSTDRSSQRLSKRQRMTVGSSTNDNGEASSDSDKEQNLAAYHSGVKTFLDTPEERRRRESRSKRFEKGQGNRSENMYHKEKQSGAVNLYSRRETALMLSKVFEDGNNQAVEDIDWDALTVKGTCQEIEKRYLRLTSAPDPATVRPEEVLEKALLMVQNSPKNYLYKCDQLKSIRQDLTVQRIRNKLTVRVYETHARLSLEAGDFPEYNQCQSQIKTLYSEGIEGCHMEFSAYSLLYVTLHSNNKRDLLSLMSRLSDEMKKDEAVKHALAVRAAVTSGNYVTYFRLYKTAPNLNTCLMDFYVEKMRYKAVSCMARAYRPLVPVSYIARVLGFTAAKPTDDIIEGISDGTELCVEWLKAHGACLITDSNGELQLDSKASSSSLYMPEPEDAVPHGDANLAVNDFLTRMPS